MNSKIFYSIIITVFLSTLNTTTPCFADTIQKDECSELSQQQPLNQCYAELYRKTDKDLNEIYTKLITEMKSKGLSKDIEKLKVVQKAWISYRDKTCNFDAALYEGGSMQPMVHAVCLIAETKHRIESLQNLMREYSR